MLHDLALSAGAAHSLQLLVRKIQHMSIFDLLFLLAVLASFLTLGAASLSVFRGRIRDPTEIPATIAITRLRPSSIPIRYSVRLIFPMLRGAIWHMRRNSSRMTS
jgi:hypothetical protein